MGFGKNYLQNAISSNVSQYVTKSYLDVFCRLRIKETSFLGALSEFQIFHNLVEAQVVNVERFSLPVRSLRMVPERNFHPTFINAESLIHKFWQVEFVAIEKLGVSQNIRTLSDKYKSFVTRVNGRLKYDFVLENTESTVFVRI